MPSKPDVSVVDSIAANSTYENDGPVEVMNNVGEGATVKIKNGGMKAASWGTPDKILKGLEERRRLLGDFEWNVSFRFGGTPYQIAERGLKLFAEEVLPVLKSW